jgi:simple sugar transport system ATP-binding protein
VTKRFGHVTALRDVSLAVSTGEVVALMGDNGAGKSTLIKVLSGALAPDSGTTAINGQEQVLTSPSAARRMGVETVYQDLALADDLSASANLFLGREIRRPGLLGRAGFFDEAAMRRSASEQIAALGATLPDVRTKVKLLSGGQRQSVAIARSAIWASTILIMDEPTAALGIAQTEQVVNLIHRTKERGVAVVVITHNVAFAIQVSDRIEVMRLGENAGSFVTCQTHGNEVVAAITGASWASGGHGE